MSLALLTSNSVWCGQARAPMVAEPPPKAPPGFFQVITSACTVETDVSQAYANKIAVMVRNAESKFYELFKLTPELMNGVSKQPFDAKANIPGSIMFDMGFRPWVEVRVYKEMERFSDELFEMTGVKDKQQQLRQGIPGAYFITCHDYDGKRRLRRIRSFVANRDDDEQERALLHEFGQLFIVSYLLEFSGGPPPGQESQKRGTPAWLLEGLSQLLELRWSKAASAQKARLRQQAMIYEAINIGDNYPFEEFINITNAQNLVMIANDPQRSILNYAQSASVMDYMVNKDSNRFFNFLQNLRQMHFERNLRSRDKNHITELYSFQNEAFKKAFMVDLTVIEDGWKKHVKKIMEEQLKRQPELYYWIGEYYLHRGKDKANDLAKAEDNFRLAMTQAPTKGEGYLGIGRLAIRKSGSRKLAAEDRQKFTDEALTMLAKAVEYLPKDDEAWLCYGIAQTNVGKYKEAAESFDKALKIYPRNARALAGLGQVACQLQQYEKAMDAYELAYEASRNLRHLFERGRAAFFGKKYREAQSDFARFCEMFPQDAQGQFWYGLAAWRLGDKDFGLKKLEEAAKLDSKDGNIKNALALAQKGEMIKFQGEDALPVSKGTEAAKPKEFIRINDE
ncbi:MAG: tetratricopeptide repeat protein [Planctomycetota bacterium]